MGVHPHWWTQGELLTACNKRSLQEILGGHVKVAHEGADLFIAGPCARNIQYEGARGKPKRQLDLHLVKTLHHFGRSRVVMFAACCGPYLDEFKKYLHRRFPLIEWVFPETGDLGTLPFVEGGEDDAKLIRELCALEILRIE